MNEWFKKHADALSVLTTLVLCMLWMNGKFNDVDLKFSYMEKNMLVLKSDLEKDIANVRADLAVLKTVLLMKNILPAELAKVEGEK